MFSFNFVQVEYSFVWPQKNIFSFITPNLKNPKSNYVLTTPRGGKLCH